MVSTASTTFGSSSTTWTRSTPSLTMASTVTPAPSPTRSARSLCVAWTTGIIATSRDSRMRWGGRSLRPPCDRPLSDKARASGVWTTRTFADWASLNRMAAFFWLSAAFHQSKYEPGRGLVATAWTS